MRLDRRDRTAADSAQAAALSGCRWIHGEPEERSRAGESGDTGTGCLRFFFLKPLRYQEHFPAASFILKDTHTHIYIILLYCVDCAGLPPVLNCFTASWRNCSLRGAELSRG